MKQLKIKDDLFEKTLKDIFHSLEKNLKIFIVYIIFSFFIILGFILTKHDIYKNFYEYNFKLSINESIFSVAAIYSELKKTSAFISRKENYKITYSEFNTEDKILKIKTSKELPSEKVLDYQNDILFNLFLSLTFDTFDENYKIVVADYNQKQFADINTTMFFNKEIAFFNKNIYFKLKKKTDDSTLKDLRKILYNEIKNTNFIYKKKVQDEIEKLKYEIFLIKQKNLGEIEEFDSENPKIEDIKSKEKTIKNLEKFLISDVKIDEDLMKGFKFSTFNSVGEFFSLKLKNEYSNKRFDTKIVRQLIAIFVLNIFLFMIMNFLFYKIKR